MAAVRPEAHGNFQQRPATITGYLSSGAQYVIVAVADSTAAKTQNGQFGTQSRHSRSSVMKGKHASPKWPG
jgi:hypothetical protein